MPCALVVGRVDAQRKQRRETKAARERLKTRSDFLKEAQQAFNAYIRERDADKPCISSGKTSLRDPLTGGAWDCGHYRSIGSCPELRFCELNAHKQTKRDNRQLSGNVVEYRKGLIERIGLENVEWLEGPHRARKYTADDLKEIRDHYRRKTRELLRKHAQVGLTG